MDKKMTRAARRRKQRNRRILMTVALMMLVAVVSIGGTIAWIIATDDPVVNTFTVGNIDITLAETPNTDTNDDGVADVWEAKLIPGTTFAKNPTVTVEGGSEACWLFIKVEDSCNVAQYANYSIASDWKALDGEPGVYYREVDAYEADQSFGILTGNQVEIPENLTKETIDSITVDKFELTFTAYAIQHDNVDTAADAWTKINAD